MIAPIFLFPPSGGVRWPVKWREGSLRHAILGLLAGSCFFSGAHEFAVLGFTDWKVIAPIQKRF